mmetsp:Transcript_5319/g.16777  ORF Transcript_5319/g.16777 Transcript_5319/m.16777 type:complete len:432 (+) Transcript_5319:233-1528(+)
MSSAPAPDDSPAPAPDDASASDDSHLLPIPRQTDPLLFWGAGGQPAWAQDADERAEAAASAAVASCASLTAGVRGPVCLFCRTRRGPDFWRQDEGLMRGCVCRGGDGFFHLTCLANEAARAVEDEEEPDDMLWNCCDVCDQAYHGVVQEAVARECWRSYVPLPRSHVWKFWATLTLGNAFNENDRQEEALPILEYALATAMGFFSDDHDQVMDARTTVANCLLDVGRHVEALQMLRDDYATDVRERGAADGATLRTALSLGIAMSTNKLFAEARTFLRAQHPLAVGLDQEWAQDKNIELDVREALGEALYRDADATPADLSEAETLLKGVVETSRKHYGRGHPSTRYHEAAYREATAVRAAGGARRYKRAPHMALLRLRSLVGRGRARVVEAPTPSLLFARSFPNELVWRILEFWEETERSDSWVRGERLK